MLTILSAFKQDSLFRYRPISQLTQQCVSVGKWITCFSNNYDEAIGFGALDGGEDGEQHTGGGFVKVSKIFGMHNTIFFGREPFGRIYSIQMMLGDDVCSDVEAKVT